MNLNDLILKVKEIERELISLKEEELNKEEKVHVDEIEGIKRLAKMNPIKEHGIKNEPEYIKIIYYAGLCSIINMEDNFKIRNEQILFLSRILEGNKEEDDALFYLNNTLKAKENFIEVFVESIRQENAIIFAIDSLILCYISGKSSEKCLELATQYMELMGIDKQMIPEICKLSKSIMLQDKELFFEAKLEEKNYFIGYIENMHNIYIGSDLEKYKNIKKDLFITNREFINLDKAVNLDTYQSSVITFYNCTFQNIKGIKSKTKNVIFKNCKFKNISVQIREWRDVWGKKHQEASEKLTLLELNRGEFETSEFIDCKVSEHLIKVENGNIENCKFTNCEGIDLPCSFLLEVGKGNILKSDFANCKIVTKTDRGHVTGGIICLSSGEIKNCNFKNCEVRGNTSYGSFAHYDMYIIKANVASVLHNNFIGCYSTTIDSGNRIVRNYIIALKNSFERFNSFSNCSSYHYTFSDIEDTHNVGEIEE